LTTRGNRKHNRHNDKGNQKDKYNGKNKNNFQGNTEGMNSNVFQCHNETQDRQQFDKTIDALYEYINKELKFAGDVSTLCDTFDVIDLNTVQPDDLNKNKKSLFKKKKLETEVERYLGRVNELDANLKHLFAVIYGQCSYSMQTKLLTSPKFETMKKKSDCGWLLKEIKGVTNQFETSCLIHVSLDVALQNYYNYYQGPSQSLHSFYKTFTSQLDVLDHYGADVGADRAFIEAAKTSLPEPDPSSNNYPTLLASYNASITDIAKKKAIAVSFLRRVSRQKYRQLCNHSEALTLWNTSLTTLEEWMLSNNGHPELVELIILGLTKWHNNERIPLSYDILEPDLAKAWSKQRRIGWTSFIEGFWVIEWRACQTTYLKHINSHKSSTLWISRVQRRIWLIAWNMWDH
jgi:hypothetical protein